MSQVETTIATPGGALPDRFAEVRGFSERLAAPLSAEDCGLQSMPDASPVKWHLAHTTWFFETFVLEKLPAYQEFDVSFRYLFNSYYNSVGEQFPRPKRGLMSRPSLEEVLAYRRHVDAAVAELLENGAGCDPVLADIVEIGLHHEQQHQELMLTDVKHGLSFNPLRPSYADGAFGSTTDAAPLEWLPLEEGIRWIGHDGDGFAFDNESPRHRVFCESFQIANRLVTCGEYLAFVEDGGYRRPELWLSLGWNQIGSDDWAAPLYWFEEGGRWREYTLAGAVDVDPNRPVCHVSYFEADAFARWADARLPTEAEWEAAAVETGDAGAGFVDRLVDSGYAVHPGAGGLGSQSLLGDAWQWTSSPYAPYPGYRPASGALGEYNGKFMCNQYVLRGGSCATHSTHIRPTYRNFFPAETRWQFAGIRLCR
ncbi:MAG: ergothioneine biosynthesis protein EgtB [Planctomycetota bacterium]